MVPIGTPTTFDIPITVTNGTIEGQTTKTITVAGGTVKTGPIIVERNPVSPAPVSASLGTISANIPDDHRGYAYALGTDTTVEVMAEAAVVDAPTDLTARPDGPNEIELAWVPPEPDPAAPVTGYRIETSTDTQTWTDAVTNTGSTETTYMHTGRVAGTTYHYRVRAVNVAGSSDASNVASAMTPALTGVCDRTPAVVIEIERATATDCSLVSAYQLAAITDIGLTGHNPTTVAEGDFGGMSGLTELNLGSGLSALPPNLLAGLASLEEFASPGGSITSIPPGFFSGRETLTLIDLSDNPLSSLPDEIFKGLRRLTSVDVTPTADGVTLPLNVEFRRVGDDGLQVRVPAGAPFELVIPVEPSANGLLAEGKRTITVPTGALASEPIQVLRIPISAHRVTVEFGTMPSIPEIHGGYELTAVNTTPFEALPGEGASVTDVIVTSNRGPYGENDTLGVTVQFDKIVTVNTTGGTPYIGIRVGTETREAAFTDGSGSNLLTFEYTVAAGDTDTDGISIKANALTRNDGTIKSAALDADLTHDAVPTIAKATVDGVAPTLLAHTVDGALITLTYDEPVQEAGTGTWPFESSIDNAAWETVCSGHVSDRTVTLTLCAAITASQDVRLRYQPGQTGRKVEDAAGNDAAAFSATTLDNITEATTPVITEVRFHSDGNDDGRTGTDDTYAIGDPIEVAVTFDGSVTVTTGGGTPELELDIGGKTIPALYTSALSQTELIFSYSVAEGDEDTNGVSIAVDALRANGGIIAGTSGKNADLTHNDVAAAANQKVDGIRPRATEAESASDGSYVRTPFNGQISTTTTTGYQVQSLTGPRQSRYRISGATIFNNRTVRAAMSPSIAYGETLELHISANTVTDSAGNRNELQVIAIADGVDEPAAYLTDVEIGEGPGENGAYTTNDVVTLTARFNKAVTLDTSGGQPEIELTLGGPGNAGHRTAAYASATGSEIAFEYTVAATDESSSTGIGIRVDPITLNGATIRVGSDNVQIARRQEHGDGTRRVNYAPPVLSSAQTATDGMSVVLTFDQALKGPAITNAPFSVTADGEPAPLSGVAADISGTTVTLSLTDTLIAANKVTVTYTDRTPDDEGVIEDALGNDAASFTVEMVTNTVAADPPDAPTGLRATTTTGRDVTLDWTAPSDTGVGDITGYRIEVSTDSAVSWEVAEADTGSDDTTYKHEGLTPGTRYNYRVSAINADGAGTASSSINTTTGAVPTISSIVITSDPDGGSITRNDDYYQGSSRPGSIQQDIEVTVTFSAAVDVQTPTATRGIALEIAGQTKNCRLQQWNRNNRNCLQVHHRSRT